MRRFLSLLVAVSTVLVQWPANAFCLATPLSGHNPFIPNSIGYLAEQFNGSRHKRVILIQDLHAHLDTQKKIIELLKFYESQGLLQHPIGLEGAQGTWDLSLLNQFPAPQKRDFFFDYLLAQAGITGPERYALKTGRPTLLYGIDQAEDFAAQRELFARTLGARRLAAAQLERVNQLLVAAEAKELQGKLHAWMELTAQFEKGTLPGDVYLKKMVSLGSRV